MRRIGGPGGLSRRCCSFAYGSNLAAEEVGAGPASLGPARAARLRAGAHAAARFAGAAVWWTWSPAPGEHVWGAAYERSGVALERLDRKEGAGFAYRRRAVGVELHGGMREAVAYEVIDKEPDVPAGHPGVRATWCCAAPASAGCRRSGWQRSRRSLSGAASVPAR